MHPQLTAQKHQVCDELIRALEACHADWLSKWTGACNGIKHDLNMCLREERKARTTRNREAAKEQRKKIEEAWRDIHED